MAAREPWEVTQTYIRSSNRFVAVVLVLSAALMLYLAYLKWTEKKEPPLAVTPIVHLPQQR